MNGSSGTERRQWGNVFCTHIPDPCSIDGIPIKGTLFLTEHVISYEKKVNIHWVPDLDQDGSLAEEFRKGYNIDIKDLSHIVRRRAPSGTYRGLYLVLKDKTFYGPFDFRTGGATGFIEALGTFAHVKKSENNNIYNIEPFTSSSYRLPSRSNQSNISIALIGAAFSRFQNSLWNQNLIGSETFGPTRSDPQNSEGNLSQCVVEDMNNLGNNEHLRTKEDSDFAVVVRLPPQIPLPPIPQVQRSSPLTVEQWKRFLDKDGRVTCVDKLRGIIFEGGVEDSIRPIVWKYLLGYYHWEYTTEENEEMRRTKHLDYKTMKAFWKPISAEREARFALFRDRKCYIDKDVPRTDRKTAFYRDDSNGNLTKLYDILMTYTMYNMDFGYFQGMSDLLALVLYVIQQEEDAFWCFVGLMNKLESNFDGDLNAVREQFYQLFALVEILDPAFSYYLELKNAKEMPFCFRWLLIHFKREFSYKDTMILWEAIWSDHLTNNFHIFFATAVLLMQRDIIMEHKFDANSILKHVNDLSYNIPLEPALNLATGYYHQLSTAIDSLPENVKRIINGPSLALSKHLSPTQSHGQYSSLDNTRGLLNEELEDLMDIEPVAHNRLSPPSIMIPLPTVDRSNEPSPSPSPNVNHVRRTHSPTVTQSHRFNNNAQSYNR